MNGALLQAARSRWVLLPVVVRGRSERKRSDHAAVYLHVSHQALLPESERAHGTPVAAPGSYL